MNEAGVIQLSLNQQEQITRTVRKESGRLLNYIRKYVRRSEDAEDILQDVFYQFTQNIDDIKYIDRVSSWLFTVARNRITDMFRKKRPLLFRPCYPMASGTGRMQAGQS